VTELSRLILNALSNYFDCRFVVTAAHCVSKIRDTWKLSFVRVGEWDTNSDPDCDSGKCNPSHQDIPIETVYLHNEYDKSKTNQHNDIALLKLAHEAVLSVKSVKLICLPTDESLQHDTLAGKELEVVGKLLTKAVEFIDIYSFLRLGKD